jgi:type IV secretory pathway VirB2 component (pilin)
MLYALALLLMIVAVIFLCLSVIFGDLEWVLTGIGALLFFGLLLLVSETRSSL